MKRKGGEMLSGDEPCGIIVRIIPRKQRKQEARRVRVGGPVQNEYAVK